jgi:AcrR family transcriptional regulator
MARWAPDAKLRLVDAAVELFDEQGYEATSVADIAERAGLAKSSFFRHFPDKREVLFAGQDILAGMFVAGISSAPPDAAPLDAVAAGLVAASAPFPQQRRAFAIQLRRVVGANPELQEREALKRARIVTAMSDALQARGVAAPVAAVAAELGALAFRTAFERWADPAGDQEFADAACTALAELRVASAALA